MMIFKIKGRIETRRGGNEQLVGMETVAYNIAMFTDQVEIT